MVLSIVKLLRMSRFFDLNVFLIGLGKEEFSALKICCIC